MLTSSFLHLRGISHKKELRLWNSGITSWEEFKRAHECQLSLIRTEGGDPLAESRFALLRNDAGFFASRMPRAEYHRIALTFPQNTLFLDIETTGLSRYYDRITIVGWSLGSAYGVYIQGGSRRSLFRAFSQAKAVVTFNGSLFDIPFIKQEFPDLLIPAAHIDLRFFAKRVGLTGGQKRIEMELGLNRSEGLSQVDGKEAPILWHRYKRGDLDSLKKLIEYNHADVEGMKVIFDEVARRWLSKLGAPDALSQVPAFAKLQAPLILSNGSRRSYGIGLPRFKGRKGPAIRFRDMDEDGSLSRLRVVGIDLTGSESRPSGWCSLVGTQAETLRVNTDEDLVRLTIDKNPAVVSIDSPLSLPHGRVSVSDDDPGRNEFGIMRICERELKRRGVNVYPCLIKSMQALTARGIRLASEFRSRGVPVIESYPGAAQDIIDIPRKGASLEFLEQGLVEYGIKGDWVGHGVSHDELDAITSALVAQFFWVGMFEALGNEDEDYLIIPDLSVDRTAPVSSVVGLSGSIASGKTTGAEFLRRRGFAYVRFSLVLEEILKEQGEEVSRDLLQALGSEIYATGKQRELGQRMVSGLPEGSPVVVDGIRHPEDHAFLGERFGSRFLHINIETSRAERRRRFAARGGDPADFDCVDGHKAEAQVDAVARLAHETISNVGSADGLCELIVEFIEARIGGRPSAG